MQAVRLALVGVSGVLFLAACHDHTGPSPEPRLKGVIVFVSDRSGDASLQRMNADGSRVQLIPTGVAGSVLFPAVSPDGRWIAYDIAGDLHVARADGTEDRNLTQSPALLEYGAAWSPDGHQLAFMSNLDGNNDIFIMNADGTGVRNVTMSPSDDRAPSWSPDGSRLVFMSDRDGATHIYSVPVAGGTATPLTAGTSNDESPWWSPDGARIVFGSTRGGSNGLYVMDSDGSNVQTLPTPGINAFFGRWSPDGMSIAFECAGAELHVCRISPDGTGLVDLTPGEHSTSQFPTWSP